MNKDYVIDGIRVYWGKMPVDLLFSHGKVDSFPFQIIRLSAGGMEGVGETPMPYGESFDGLIGSLIGCDARGLDALLPHARTSEELYVSEALSMALHDLVGRISGLPVCTLLGGAKEESIPLMPCIFPKSPDDARSKAEHFFSRGYNKFLKTKLVGNLEEDLPRVRAIRSIAPKGLILQGDANKGYKSLREARHAVNELGDAGLDIFEDPLDGGVDEYKTLTASSSGAKVMVDDLARRTSDLVAVLRAGAADVIGIHPVQPGCLSRAKQHTQLAQAFGVPVVIGGTGYSSVGSAAYQHLTAAVAPGGPCGELGGFFDHGMPCTLIEEPLQMRDGRVFLPERPGLGVDLNENVLAKMAQGYKEFGT